MNSSVGIRELRYVCVEQALVYPNPCDVEQIRAGGYPKTAYDVVECPVRAAGNVCAISMLGVREIRPNQKACLSNEVWDEDDL